MNQDPFQVFRRTESREIDETTKYELRLFVIVLEAERLVAVSMQAMETSTFQRIIVDKRNNNDTIHENVCSHYM